MPKIVYQGLRSTSQRIEKQKQFLTDGYLVRQLGEYHDWIGEVCKQISGYAHLSEKHFYNAFGKNQDDKNLSFVAGEKDHFTTEKDRFEATYAMFQLIGLVLWVLNSWASTKETPNPEQWLKKHGKE